MDLYDQLEKLLLFFGVRPTARFGPRPQAVVAAVRHENPAQALDREPISKPVDEREPLACGRLMNQRLRGFMQNFVLHPQPLKFPAKPPQLGMKYSVHGYQLTVINSPGHD